ncbi:GTP pyrophosphokinase [Paraeggerthella hongkongensis]|nr:(p)ppGpp synthetase [Paraeggerthella hongkongensis]
MNMEVAFGVKDEPSLSDDRVDQGKSAEGGAMLPAFRSSDDLRGPIEDLQRLREAEAKTREIIQKYQAAMREMQVRFEILDQDLNLKKNRNPIHHIESRIKKPASIFEKLERYGKQPTLENMERYIMDIAGIRVICSYIHDVYNLLELLQRQDDLTIVTVKDYIASPKPNGYRSLHVIVRIPVYFLDKKEFIPVEVQLRTIAMDFWASLEHDLKYKAVREVEGLDSYAELKDCSKIIEDVEARMQILARALEMGK